ncbi:MAG: HK97 gp10 family phage protein [Patescibacteria group bacterium]|nr:HK97 gp10 family phage protein [Patescibacteria group bacterium]
MDLIYKVAYSSKEAKAIIAGQLAKISPNIMRSARKTLNQLSFMLAEKVKEKYDEAGLHVRTGALKSSIHAEPVQESRDGLTARVMIGQKLPYARVQEFGAEIHPKNAQFLTIPLDAAKTAAGVTRFSARDATAYGYQSTFVHNGIIFGKNGKTITPLFVLKRMVKIPARPFAFPALKSMQEQIEQGISEAIATGIRESLL